MSWIVQRQAQERLFLNLSYEEQLLVDKDNLMDQDDKYFWYPEAVDFINDHSKEMGVAEYITLIKEAKQKTSIPILASVNCITPAEWPKFAAKLEEAGIDGLELNIAIMPFDPKISSQEIEDTYVEIVTEVKKYVTVPIAVKDRSFFHQSTKYCQKTGSCGSRCGCSV